MSDADRHQVGVPDHERTLRYARQLLIDNRHELRRADTKATQLLGAAGTIAAVAFAAVSGTELAVVMQGWWLAAFLLWGMAVLLAALALLPRLGGLSPERHVSYFGDVLRHDDLAEALRLTATQPLGATLAELRWTSNRLSTKYWLVRGAIVVLGASGFCLIMTVL
ncbi:Pycsar system effector family protein [Micromonospora sp. NPDC051196]|uniref:Pycsar system effector family protein n=1 Tax=Micromonospora sp. NPDC051196 TaxID=3155281 RepID=UPI003434BE19